MKTTLPLIILLVFGHLSANDVTVNTNELVDSLEYYADGMAKELGIESNLASIESFNEQKHKEIAELKLKQHGNKAIIEQNKKMIQDLLYSSANSICIDTAFEKTTAEYRSFEKSVVYPDICLSDFRDPRDFYILACKDNRKLIEAAKKKFDQYVKNDEIEDPFNRNHYYKFREDMVLTQHASNAQIHIREFLKTGIPQDKIFFRSYSEPNYSCNDLKVFVYERAKENDRKRQIDILLEENVAIGQDITRVQVLLDKALTLKSLLSDIADRSKSSTVNTSSSSTLLLERTNSEVTKESKMKALN